MAKRALVVGINSYPFPNDLSSGARDAEAFAGVLETAYRFEHVRVLKDGEATRDGLDRGLEWLFQGATPNDRLVFFFSGHGHRFERGGTIEEAIVLQDGRSLEGRELAERMDVVAPAVLTVVLDCGFAGGLDELLLLPDGGVDVARTKRWLPGEPERIRHERTAMASARAFTPFGHAAPLAVESLAMHFRTATSLEPSTARLVAFNDPQSKCLLVSASLEDESAVAATSQTSGLSAFTFGMVSAIKRLGPNRSAIELIQAAGHELRRLGFRQTPIVKEPLAPEHLGLRSFLTFQPALFVYSPSAPGAETGEDLTRSIAEAVRNTFSSKEGSSMLGTTIGSQTFQGDDVATIVNTVTPIVSSLLQQRGYQPYTGSLSQGGIGFQSPMSGGLQQHEIAQLVGTITPIVASLLQSRAQQPFLPGLASPFPGMGFGAHGTGATSWSGLPYAGWSGMQQQTPWGGFGQGGRGPEEIAHVVSATLATVLPLLQQRGSQGAWPQMGFGFQPQFQHQMGPGIQPHEIAQIVSTVTPIVTSLLQSRYQAQVAQQMPRAA
jgi:caspase domain-containing protein